MFIGKADLTERKKDKERKIFCPLANTPSGLNSPS